MDDQSIPIPSIRRGDGFTIAELGNVPPSQEKVEVFHSNDEEQGRVALFAFSAYQRPPFLSFSVVRVVVVDSESGRQK